MVHEVTIPFSFDTSPIEAHMASIGEKEVARVIEELVRKGVREALPQKTQNSYWDWNETKKEPEVNWAKFMEDSFHRWLEPHAQEIVDEAALLLAKRVERRKSWREALDELREERETE